MSASLESATAEFYSALNAIFTGDVGPMTKVWSHADDISFVGAGGGTQLGWEDVLAEWEAVAALKLSGEIKATGLRVIKGQDLGVTQNYEIGENRGPDGKTVKVNIRATNVFRKEDGVWKMISHHADVLPFLNT